MAQIVRREHRQRGFFGWVFLILFILFNLVMAAFLFLYLHNVSRDSGMPTTEAGTVGHIVGGTLVMGVLAFFWVAGAVILGLFALLTRGSRVITEEIIGGSDPRYQPTVDTRQWSQRDRDRYNAERARNDRR